MKRRLALGATVLALSLSGCGGDDDQATPTPTQTDEVDTPTPTTTPPSATGGLPPEFVECMAEQGYEIESPTDIHAAPPQVLQACFGSIHGGAGGP